MKNIVKIHIILFILFFGSGCGEWFLDPGYDNIYNEDETIGNPHYAEGILLNAYANLPSNLDFDDVATDNAVSNVKGDPYSRIATGDWKSYNNPLAVWNSAYVNINYLNKFLSIVDEVEWSWRYEWQNQEFPKKFKGEAYGLRAFYQYLLLVYHSGKVSGGQLTGFPIITSPLTTGDNWRDIKRGTYKECVDQILTDLDSAIFYLPEVWANAIASDPNKFNFDAVYGARNRNRMNGQAAMLLKARVLLHAASHAFSESNAGTYAQAANAAAVLINKVGGLSKLTSARNEYWLSLTNTDILWRRDRVTNNYDLEADNFPPSLFGNGKVNPSQNFVDAFPMKSGEPIDDAIDFDPDFPYLNRDPRLDRYVLRNGSVFRSTTINTIDGEKDGFNQIETSTRTGYYLKKHMFSNVNLTPGSVTGQVHFHTLMRYTEAFLIYAEAANLAWGPDVDGGGNGFTARQVITQIRSTAGITPDNYLASLVSDVEMDALIRNERRIELSFEGFRFWDIRRWNEIDLMKETVNGTNDGGLTSIEVEPRRYNDYMIYPPIPDAEYRKGMAQNAGW